MRNEARSWRRPYACHRYARVERADGRHSPKGLACANGSLFTYFETKADLFNHLYLDLKEEMASAAMKEPSEKDVAASSADVFTFGQTG